MSQKNAHHLLILDDEPNIVKLYGALLRNNGYVVSEFMHAAEALQYLENTDNNIDLIIADVNMPDLNGIQFLDKLKKNSHLSSIPVIFLSAISDSAMQVNAYNLGAVDYLTKPVKKEIFLSKIKALLQSYSQKKIMDNVYLKGNEKDKKIDEIVAFCETKKFTGFAAVYHENRLGLLHFVGGMLEKIELENFTDADAYDRLNDWPNYRFVLIQGKYDESLLKEVLQISDITEPDDREKAKISLPSITKESTDEGIIESFSINDDTLPNPPANGADRPVFFEIYRNYANFTFSLAKLLNQKLISACIEFTNKQVLDIRIENGTNKFIMFKNKKAFSQNRGVE